MDIDLVKRLEDLEIEKRKVNASIDLSKECSSICELDNRIALLLEKISAIREIGEKHGRLVAKSCDKLLEPYNVLVRTSQIFDLSAELTKLNRLCRQFDKIKDFYNFPINHLDNNKQQPNGLSGNNNSLDSPQAHQMLEVIEKFHSFYAPLEDVLSQRLDLPYVHYANNMRSLKAVLMMKGE